MIPVYPARLIFSMLKLSADIKEILNSHSGINIILTVGNSLRSDDGAGPYIFSKLEADGPLKVINAGFAPENIIDEVIEIKPDRIVIIDAADFGGFPGEIRMVSAEDIPEISLSTHMVSLKVIAKILSEDTKAEILFLGIQPKSVSLGEGLSKEVKSSADEIIDYLTEG